MSLIEHYQILNYIIFFIPSDLLPIVNKNISEYNEVLEFNVSI